MERYMYQDDSFERMLKQKADEYRMYPTDQSWDVIYNQLHHPSKFNWKLTSFLTLTFVSLSLWVSVNQHNVNPAVVKTTNTEGSNVAVNKPVRATNNSSVRNIVAPQKAINALLSQTNNNEEKAAVSTETTATSTETTITAPATSEVIKQNNTVIADPAADVPVVIPTKEEKELSLSFAQELRSKLNVPAAAFNQTAPAMISLQQNNNAESTTVAAVDIADENRTDAELNYEVKVPVTIHTPTPKAFLQFHITPSASYRVLVSDNKFNFGNLRDPNTAVVHRTSIGFEAGATFVKPLSNVVSFTAGLQFNFTNYTLVGSRYNPELATVILNSARNIQRFSDLRTQNGYFPLDISNRTFQLSAPVGLQLRLFKTPRFSWNMGTSIQPTYLLNATGYLVTNDFKNYIKAPDFIRRFNLNYSIETFIRFNSGKSQFMMGPQFRYQLLSNSKGNYPVQEHLVDYGFRIGFVRPL
jgi:hypothetical protein